MRRPVRDATNLLSVSTSRRSLLPFPDYRRDGRIPLSCSGCGARQPFAVFALCADTTLGSISVDSRSDVEAMNRAIATHRLHPMIDRTVPFAEAKNAYRYFKDRGHFGKVVITRE